MAKRMDPKLLDRIKSDPDGGLSRDFIDWAFWLSDPSSKKYAVTLRAEEWPWVMALAQLDRLGNKGPLQQLLKSDCEQSPRVRKYLADLVLRSGSPRGRPQTPAYTMSQNKARLLIACESVRAYVQRGMRVDDALDKVAKEWGVSRSALDNSYNDRASLRKSKKRL